MKKKILLLLLFTCFCTCANAAEWKNDLRSKFLNNETMIMEINIRSFNSQDLDSDGFIQEERGEVRGTFINAIDRLDEIKNLGINTLHILPITPTGRLKALGTAGSLYSASDFSTLSPFLQDTNSELTLEQQAKKFIQEAHNRGIRIIVDVPACASYDLYLQRPDLFVRNAKGEPVLPADWTDVRLLATGTEEKIDSNVYSLYKDFVKYMISLGVDGIRADVAHCKTKAFWQKLIEYSRTKDPEFLWLAESSESWSEPISPYAVFTPYNELLDAGFDGYYGSFFNLKDWKTGKELNNQILQTLNNTKNFTTSKSAIGSFTTHDEVSPIRLKGQSFSDMIIWLNATLPINSYFVDGFQTGDDYNYLMGNKTAQISYTDDEIYFTHRGQIDIFNLSRKPGGNNGYIKNNFILGNNVKKSLLPILNNGTFTPIKIKNPNIFGYSYEYNKQRLFVFGNLDFNESQKLTYNIPKCNSKTEILPLKISDMPQIKNGKFTHNLKAGEIIVFIIK